MKSLRDTEGKSRLLVDYRFSPGLAIPGDTMFMYRFLTNISMHRPVASDEHYSHAVDGKEELKLAEESRRTPVAVASLVFDETLIVEDLDVGFSSRRVGISLWNRRRLLIKTVPPLYVKPRKDRGDAAPLEKASVLELALSLETAGLSVTENPCVWFMPPPANIPLEVHIARWMGQFDCLLERAKAYRSCVFLHPCLVKFVEEYNRQMSNGSREGTIARIRLPFPTKLDTKTIKRWGRSDAILSIRSALRDVCSNRRTATKCLSIDARADLAGDSTSKEYHLQMLVMGVCGKLPCVVLRSGANDEQTKNELSAGAHSRATLGGSIYKKKRTVTDADRLKANFELGLRLFHTGNMGDIARFFERRFSDCETTLHAETEFPVLAFLQRLVTEIAALTLVDVDGITRLWEDEQRDGETPWKHAVDAVYLIGKPPTRTTAANTGDLDLLLLCDSVTDEIWIKARIGSLLAGFESVNAVRVFRTLMSIATDVKLFSTPDIKVMSRAKATALRFATRSASEMAEFLPEAARLSYSNRRNPMAFRRLKDRSSEVIWLDSRQPGNYVGWINPYLEREALARTQKGDVYGRRLTLREDDNPSSLAALLLGRAFPHLRVSPPGDFGDVVEAKKIAQKIASEKWDTLEREHKDELGKLKRQTLESLDGLKTLPAEFKERVVEGLSYQLALDVLDEMVDIYRAVEEVNTA
ncbi:MAG: hypothetical protein AB1393_08000 [Candidatus Edwardsbacteria bacterium]